MPPPIDPATPPMQLLARFGPESEPAPAPSLEESMAYVRGLSSSHYENFHVLSSLVPVDLRDDFAAVYAFCRWADDLGDETGDTDEARARSLSLLGWWRQQLQGCFAWAMRSDGNSPIAQGVDQGSSPTPRVEPNGPTHPVFIALAETVRRHGSGGGEHQSGGAGPLTITPFDRLIQAFELDQTLHHYQTWDQLLHYCTLSADPVGRIVLALAGYADTPENAQLYAMSDATCTALQLTNH
ncbi:MAG: squalene/phytoene synthase family protein, partial [Pyrinomonadaceae bacterium]|nr:squalene/phytoene synthase family protein [Phycisphaerales bacterium]